MPTWNPEQYKAIHTQNKNVLVSASAGAGKTTVLIARLVDLILHQHIGIEHILAMTFTEAAANEMKKRLAAELHMLYGKEIDAAKKQYLSEQLAAISDAHISTIHSFCLSILQQFYYTIGLSAKMVNNIMDDAHAQMAKEQAMERTFAIQYRKNDTAFYQLTSMFSSRSESDENLKKAIMTLAQSANAQSDPDAWMQRCLSHYQPYASLHDLDEGVLAYFFAALKSQWEQYAYICEELHGLYQTTYVEETKKAALMETKCKAMPALCDTLEKQDYSAFREAFIGICHIVIPPAPNKEDSIYADLRKRAVQIEDTLLERLYEESTLLSDMADLHEPVAKLIEMCKDYMQAFADIKMAMQCIDFDDMEHFALRILTINNGQVANYYRTLFEQIMVDEFQDSNDVQNELVNLICRGNNVFRVGDIKQSIYGFRHAKPQLMRGLIDHAGVNDEVIYLSNNYRSKKMIVDFNNALYQELMNVNGFHSRYDDTDNVKCGVAQQETDNVPIVFHAIDAESVQKESDHIRSGNEWKASYIASQIVKIKTTQQRQWKDFVVLVRSNARKQDIKQVFDEWNIPSFIDVSGGFYHSNAIQIVLSVLNALTNPNDEISFVAALSSPLFQISLQELSDIRLAKGTQGYYAYMSEMAHPIMESFTALRKMIDQNTICEVLNALYARNHFYEHHTSPQERSNLDMLFEKAITYEQEEGKGMTSFLKAINEVKDMESAEAMPIGSEDDVVRVMSIHQSKGLQFPIVFLWSSSKQRALSFQELYLCDSELGLGMMHVDIKPRFLRPTLHRMAMEYKVNREELEEEMRILYVATTRPQQQLHIVDCVKAKDGYRRPLNASIVYERGGYTAWILHSALAHQPASLFTVISVSHEWQTEVQPKPAETIADIAYYHNEDPIWEIAAPSTMAHSSFALSASKNAQAGMQYGTRMHAYIEALPKRMWTSTDYHALTPPPSLQEQNTLQKLSENALFRKANTYPDVYHELPFTVKEGNRIVHGYMDFAAIGDDIIIIDFKTDADKNEAELKQCYEKQLLSYGKAMQILYPDKQIHTYLYSLKLHKEIAITTQEIFG